MAAFMTGYKSTNKVEKYILQHRADIAKYIIPLRLKYVYYKTQ